VNERDAFLKALDDNEDDTLTRRVYADWLDENGEYDEADRQRKWPAAKGWLVQFCYDNNPQPDEESDEYVISYEVLLELGQRAVEEADEDRFGFSCANNMTMCDALRANSAEFWKNWAIVTGIPLPSNHENTSHFSCGC
jgi:uncharacterized protein (TIGR02996 family)